MQKADKLVILALKRENIGGLYENPMRVRLRRVCIALFQKAGHGGSMDTIKIQKTAVKMIAHRGVSLLEPENTAAAFVAAGNRSYFGIETDVHVTKDGHFVVVHDDNLKRVAGIDRVVENSTWKELAPVQIFDNLYVKNLEELREKGVHDPSSARRDLRLPLLADYIGICRRYGKTAVLELKNPMAKEAVDGIVQAVQGQGWLERTIFISFFWDNLLRIKQQIPGQKVQFLTERCDGTLMERLEAFGMDLDIEYRGLTQELVNRLHDKKIEVNCWTCDDPAEGEKLSAWGVDYITSNILEAPV